MPVSVRLFFGLCLAMAAWLAYGHVMFIFIPSSEYLAGLAKIPPDMAGHARAFDVRNHILNMTVWGAVLLGLGSLAAFGRYNWARWAMAGVLVFIELFWLGIDFYLHARFERMPFFWSDYIQENWTKPTQLLFTAVEALLIVLIFSPDARRWFRREPA